jgi:hypothetical protein
MPKLCFCASMRTVKESSPHSPMWFCSFQDHSHFWKNWITAPVAGQWHNNAFSLGSILVSPEAQSQSHITTDDQSVSASWFRAPSGAHDQILITV